MSPDIALAPVRVSIAVKGTPTDCVIMGVREILRGRQPDLVLSGVNRGSNIADDVTYSGTIAAAIEVDGADLLRSASNGDVHVRT